jgi:hypothetical protein
MWKYGQGECEGEHNLEARTRGENLPRSTAASAESSHGPKLPKTSPFVAVASRFAADGLFGFHMRESLRIARSIRGVICARASRLKDVSTRITGSRQSRTVSVPANAGKGG